ncbi:hypothetical protein EJ08DRAFT_186944 [Tothia fuscella]|uniref:Uncharacterized protein n=1 Tax=Tothia fuscella TaxID=1048955 RepID=A0A9P4NTH0_9PEZI|nr:hypothetical protein EJ08DRAFT_186944 [Tothia fuscella]
MQIRSLLRDVGSSPCNTYGSRSSRPVSRILGKRSIILAQRSISTGLYPRAHFALSECDKTWQNTVEFLPKSSEIFSLSNSVSGFNNQDLSFSLKPLLDHFQPIVVVVSLPQCCINNLVSDPTENLAWQFAIDLTTNCARWDSWSPRSGHIIFVRGYRIG